MAERHLFILFQPPIQRGTVQAISKTLEKMRELITPALPGVWEVIDLEEKTFAIAFISDEKTLSLALRQLMAFAAVWAANTVIEFLGIPENDDNIFIIKPETSQPINLLNRQQMKSFHKLMGFRNSL